MSTYELDNVKLLYNIGEQLKRIADALEDLAKNGISTFPS